MIKKTILLITAVMIAASSLSHAAKNVQVTNESKLDAFYKVGKTIKKINGLHIECIYEDTLLCKLIYASQYYLKTIDKDKVIIYNKFKRERGYSDNENMILDVVSKKPRAGSI
jgi:hypothetical protein